MRLSKVMLVVMNLLVADATFGYTCSPGTTVLTIPDIDFAPSDPEGKEYWTWTYSRSSSSIICIPANSGYANESICTGTDASMYNTQLALAGLKFVYTITNSGESYSGIKNGNRCDAYSSPYTTTRWPQNRVFLYNAPYSQTSLGGIITVRLVRNEVAGSQLQSFSLAQGSTVQNVSWGGGVSTDANIIIKLGSKLDIVPGTCTVNSPVVNLGTHNMNEFPAINTATPARTSFQLRFTCQKSTSSKAGYYFTPLVINSVSLPPGVFELNGSSTARGVGVQVTDVAGTGICFGSTCTYSLKNTKSAGTFTKTWYAAYFKTAATVTAGTANSGLTVTVVYQ